LGFKPHELLVQILPDAQSTSTVQAVKHRAPLQTNGAQAIASGAAQFPFASQVEAGV
jgi:hypothetical protein